MITTRPRGGPHTANARPAVALRRAPVLTEPLSLPSSRVRREGELLRADNAAVRQESRLHRHRRWGGRGAGSEKGASPVSRAASPPLLGHVAVFKGSVHRRPHLPLLSGSPFPRPFARGSIPIRTSQKHPEQFPSANPRPCAWLPPLAALDCFWDTRSGAQRRRVGAGQGQGWCTCVRFIQCSPIRCPRNPPQFIKTALS